MAPFPFPEYLSSNDALGEALRAAFNSRELPLLQGWVYFFAAAVTLFTTAVSLRRPVRIASKISPVEAMRYDGPGCRTKQSSAKVMRISAFSVLSGPICHATGNGL